MEVLWMISPLVLIPLLIHFVRKSGRYENHINDLFRFGRIDQNEYFRIMNKMPPPFLRNGMPPVGAPPQGMQGAPYVPSQGTPSQGTPVAPPQGQPITPPQGVPVAPPQGQPAPQPVPQTMQPQPMPYTVPQGVPVQQPVPPVGTPPQGTQGVPPQGMPRPQYFAPQQGNPVQGMMPPPAYQPIPQPEKEKVSSSSVMLTVGVILVSIAGLIFATALWASFGGGGRTGIIAFAALFFFAICSFSYKKLGLKNSSNAFFSLGAIFTTITYLTAGYYELFGSEFSFDGGHKWGFVSGAVLIVTALAAIGHKLYQKRYLAITSLAGGFAAFMALAYDISSGSDGVFSMLSAIALSACLGIVILIKGKPDWAADTLKVCAGLAAVSAANSPFIQNIGKWGAADFVNAVILFAIISLYAFRRNSRPMLGLHSIYMLAVSCSMVLQIFMGNDNDAALYVSLFLVIMALGLVYRGFAVLRTAVSDNVFSVALGITLIAMADESDNNIIPFVCALLLAVYLCIFALDKKPYSKIYAVITPAVLAYGAAAIDSYVTYAHESDPGLYTAIGLSVIYSLIALGLCALSKKPLKFELNYISGAFTVFAAVCTVVIADSTARDETAQRLMALAAAVFALFVTCRSRLQIASALPAFMCAVIAAQCGDSLAPDSVYAGKLTGALMAYAAFMILSRAVFSEQVYSYVYNKSTRLDPFVFGAASAVLTLFTISDQYVSGFMAMKSVRLYQPTAIDYILPLLAWVSLTALIMLLIRPKNPASLNTIFAIGGSLSSLGVSARLITFIKGFINADYNIGSLVAALIVFVCLCILSRVIFAEGLIKKTENCLFPDIFAVSAAAALFSIYLIPQQRYYRETYQTELFLFWLAAGAFAFILIRKKSSPRLNTALKLISSGAWLIAFIERPFLVSDTDTVEMKVTVIAIAVFGFAAKFILRKNEKLSENFATAVHVFAMILLIGDALVNQSLINTIIVLTVAAAVMVISFIIKKKRWFLISAVMLVGLTIYICKDFLTSISWWVYLLVIGILLISIAVSNEYFKNKNEQQGVPEKKGRFFEEWKW